jgi:hypothetical protein
MSSPHTTSGDAETTSQDSGPARRPARPAELFFKESSLKEQPFALTVGELACTLPDHVAWEVLQHNVLFVGDDLINAWVETVRAVCSGGDVRQRGESMLWDELPLGEVLAAREGQLAWAFRLDWWAGLNRQRPEAQARLFVTLERAVPEPDDEDEVARPRGEAPLVKVTLRVEGADDFRDRLFGSVCYQLAIQHDCGLEGSCFSSWSMTLDGRLFGPELLAIVVALRVLKRHQLADSLWQDHQRFFGTASSSGPGSEDQK